MHHRLRFIHVAVVSCPHSYCRGSIPLGLSIYLLTTISIEVILWAYVFISLGKYLRVRLLGYRVSAYLTSKTSPNTLESGAGAVSEGQEPSSSGQGGQPCVSPEAGQVALGLADLRERRLSSKGQASLLGAPSKSTALSGLHFLIISLLSGV